MNHFETFFFQSGEKKKDDETVDSLGEELSVWTSLKKTAIIIFVIL